MPIDSNNKEILKKRWQLAKYLLNGPYKNNPAAGMRVLARALFLFDKSPQNTQNITVNGQILLPFDSKQEKETYLKKHLDPNSREWAEEAIVMYVLDQLGYQTSIAIQSQNAPAQCYTEQQTFPDSGLEIHLVHEGTTHLDYHWRLQDKNVPGDGSCFYHALAHQVQQDLPYMQQYVKPETTTLPESRRTAAEVRTKVSEQYQTEIDRRNHATPIEPVAHDPIQADSQPKNALEQTPDAADVSDEDFALQFAFEELQTKIQKNNEQLTENSTATMVDCLSSASVIASQQRELDYWAQVKAEHETLKNQAQPQAPEGDEAYAKALQQHFNDEANVNLNAGYAAYLQRYESGLCRAEANEPEQIQIPKFVR